MKKFLNKCVKSPWFWPITVLFLGLCSLYFSFVAAGLDYMDWEANGELPYYQTPDWILYWHGLSLLILLGALILIAWQTGRAIKEHRASKRTQA